MRRIVMDKSQEKTATDTKKEGAHVKEKKSTPAISNPSQDSARAKVKLRPPPTTIDSSKQSTWSQAVSVVLQPKKHPYSTLLHPTTPYRDPWYIWQALGHRIEHNVQ